VHSYRDPEHPVQRPITAQLVAIAAALLLVFLASLLPQLLPLRLLDPSWQLRLCGVMSENGVLPLMALGLLFLATYLDPDNAIIRSLRESASWLAGVAALGFLLLIPLQLAALAQASSRLDLRQQQQRQIGQERLDAIKQAIAAAGSNVELNQRLVALQAPPLPAAELVLPLPQLRQLLSQRLLQTRALLQRSFSRPAQRPLHTLLLQALRGVLSNLAYGLAFAACAYGRRQQRSLLQAWLAGVYELRWRACVAAQRGRNAVDIP
jgi:hypothetical protein